MIIHEKAYAKLNLSLDIVKKMSDGYHDMKMVFQTVDLHDDVTIKITDSPKISLKANVRYVPTDDSNIAVKAAKAFFTKSNITNHGAEIELFKRVPVCAGMGGGSADGAAVLRALNKSFDNPLTIDELLLIGRDLGADVPFCIIGGTVLGCGRGDEMTDLPALPDCHIVICKPSFSVSTPTLFKQIDCKKIRLRPDTEGIIAALNKNDLIGVGRRVFNVFEDVLPIGRDVINEIKGIFYEYKTVGTAMTGTGSAVFALFDNEVNAKSAYAHLKTMYSECYLAKPIGRLI